MIISSQHHLNALMGLQVVVDRAFFDFDEIKSSVVSQSEGGEHIRNGPASAGLHGGTNTTEHDSLGPSSDGFWGISFPLVILRYRFWPAVVNFFTLSFEDPQSEDRYKKETWFLQKSLALWSSLFMILNWVSRPCYLWSYLVPDTMQTLTTATLPPPVQVPDRIFFYGSACIVGCI
jgi:osomolarity two-component system sensor histidine kinase SLN1